MRVASAPASLADAMTSVRTRTTWSEWVSAELQWAPRQRMIWANTGAGTGDLPPRRSPPAGSSDPAFGRITDAQARCSPAISSRPRTRMKVLRSLRHSALVAIPVHGRGQRKASRHGPDRRDLQHQSASQDRRADEELPVHFHNMMTTAAESSAWLTPSDDDHRSTGASSGRAAIATAK